MAYASVADVIADVRVLLQDTIAGPYRYSDAELLTALNKGLLEARRVRPDLFIGRAVPTYDAISSTAVAIDEQYLSALSYYIVGQAQLRDNEETTDARSVQFLNKFVAQMMTIPS